MSGAYWSANWQIWVSALCVLAVYSYLIKDNPVYRAMMQIFIGLNLGYQAIVQWRDVLYPQWWLPMIDGFKALFGGPGSPWGALWSLVAVVGVMFYLQLSRKYAWLSKIAIGITIGIGAGLTFKSQLGRNIPQVLDTFRPLTPAMVQPQTRRVARLPGTSFQPTVDGSLGFFVSGTTVSADEILGGVELWRASLPSVAIGPALVNGDAIGIPTASGEVFLNRSTGKTAAPFAIPAALGVAKSAEVIGEDGGFLFTHKGRRMIVRDSLDKHVLCQFDLPSEPSLLPAAAIYRHLQHSGGVALVPVGDTLFAYAVRDNVGEGISPGERLWSQKYGEPIVSVQAFEGVALVSGAKDSAVWEIPDPYAQLSTKDLIDNWISVITVLCVMTYFFFSFKRGPATNGMSQVGRWLLMIAFGAFFGNTVMTRMSYLVDRLMFLIDVWLGPFFHQFFR